MGLLKYHALWWVTWIGGGILEASLGFLLGYGLINKFVLSNSPEAEEKGKRLLERLTPLQGRLGLLGIVVGVWVIFTRIFLY